MFFTIIFYIYVGLFFLFSLLPAIWAVILRIFGREKQRKFLQKVTSWWGRSHAKFAGVSIQVEGSENLPKEKSLLFVSNHQSYWDIPVVMASLPRTVGFIAKKELGRIPIINIWLKLLGCILIDRKNPRKAIKSIEKGAESIQKGNAVLIFPEGTRSKKAKMNIFKRGSLKLAIKSGAKIVPLTINGTYKLYEGPGNRIKSGKAKLYIHPPIDVSQLSNEERRNLPEIVYNQIKSKLDGNP